MPPPVAWAGQRALELIGNPVDFSCVRPIRFPGTAAARRCRLVAQAMRSFTSFMENAPARL
jgi:hypothetical protein